MKMLCSKWTIDDCSRMITIIDMDHSNYLAFADPDNPSRYFLLSYMAKLDFGFVSMTLCYNAIVVYLFSGHLLFDTNFHQCYSRFDSQILPIYF